MTFLPKSLIAGAIACGVALAAAAGGAQAGVGSLAKRTVDPVRADTAGTVTAVQYWRRRGHWRHYRRYRRCRPIFRWRYFRWHGWRRVFVGRRCYRPHAWRRGHIRRGHWRRGYRRPGHWGPGYRGPRIVFRWNWWTHRHLRNRRRYGR